MVAAELDPANSVPGETGFARMRRHLGSARMIAESSPARFAVRALTANPTWLPKPDSADMSRSAAGLALKVASERPAEPTASLEVSVSGMSRPFVASRLGLA
jgi:hypothetical protein